MSSTNESVKQDAAPQTLENTLRVYGYRYSVYTRIVRWTLAEKNLAYDYVELNAFDTDAAQSLATLHPFAQVPVVQYGSFRLFETVAITRYIDQLSESEVSLQPTTPQATARMVQIQSIIDQHGYYPMVRQVFANRVFRPFENQLADEQEIAQGVANSRCFLHALSTIMESKTYLCGQDISLADLHLAPMIDYLQLAPEGAMLLEEFPGVLKWWETISQRSLFIESRQFEIA